MEYARVPAETSRRSARRVLTDSSSPAAAAAGEVVVEAFAVEAVPPLEGAWGAVPVVAPGAALAGSCAANTVVPSASTLAAATRVRDIGRPPTQEGERRRSASPGWSGQSSDARFGCRFRTA